MHYWLCVEPPLFWGKWSNKERHRALKQRETDHTQHKVDFVEPWITTAGGADINKAALFTCRLGMLFVPTWYFSSSKIFWGAAWRAALCLLRDPSEVTLVSTKSWKGRGAASWSPSLLFSLESTRCWCEPALTSWRHSAYVLAFGCHMAERATPFVRSPAWCWPQKINSWHIIQLWIPHLSQTEQRVSSKFQSSGAEMCWTHVGSSFTIKSKRRKNPFSSGFGVWLDRNIWSSDQHFSVTVSFIQSGAIWKVSFRPVEVGVSGGSRCVWVFFFQLCESPCQDMWPTFPLRMITWTLCWCFWAKVCTLTPQTKLSILSLLACWLKFD